MRLVALELHGFKSFADVQKLVFPGGMTAVVGPNGCGKSNISDALAWVLGEQRASLLRGSEMADVIFAGTDTRRPMGLAEVKLTLEMLDPATPGATREVVVARRLYRDQGAEYRLNGRECRLKDIHDLLMDTGMGTRAYSFIQQGQIDLILSTKPKDRRGLIEEAAGITRYKLRRAEAERRLEDTRGNLTRLDDILFELNKQLESLKRQAAKARRAQELDAAIRATQRILLAGRALELEAAKGRIVEQLDGFERRIAELTAQAAEKAGEIEHLRLHLEEAREGQERRQRALMGLDQRLGLMEQDRAFQQERIQEAGLQRDQLQERLQELEGRRGGWDGEIAVLEARLAGAETALEGRETLVADAEEAVALAGGQLRRVEQALRELRVERAEAERAALQQQKARQAIHHQIAVLEGRLDALNHEEALRAPRLEGLQAEDGRLGREREAAEERLEGMEEAVQVQGRLRQEAEAVLRDLQGRLRESETQLDAQERRLRSLGDQLRQATGGEAQQQALAALRAGGHGVLGLADVLGVDEALRPDLERLLGDWAQAVAGAPDGALAELPGQLRAHLEDIDAAPSEVPEGLEPLAPGLRWKAGAPRILEGLMARAFRCADADLPDLARRHPGLALVSPKLVKLPFGPVEVGQRAPLVSPLKLKAEQEAARGLREAALEAVEALEEAARTAGLRAQEAQERAREMEEDRSLARRGLEDLKGRQASVRGQLREIEEAQLRADAQWETLEGDIQRQREQLRSLEPEAAEEGAQALLDRIHEAEGRQGEAQEHLEARREALLEATRMREGAWSERDAVQRQLLQLQRAAFDLEGEKRRIQEDAAQAGARITTAEARLEELEAQTQACLDERAAVAAVFQEMGPRLEEEGERLRVEERLGRELQASLESARQLHHETLLGGATVAGSLEAVSREIELALGMAVPDFLASVTETEREAWAEGELVHQTRLGELQGRRLDLGGVNPLAIQELAEAEERMAFMQQQRGDVLEAMANLEGTIGEINATSEERFREAFEFINQKFQGVFQEVFGGGSAHLTLQDPKDLLECGIEIMAQPPGKSPKALSLLSGGEKALTAISLLFAIFHYKPSPFCVLDEVDAPLDEANVARFAAMVQKMKDSTQFIVITHQKPTMVAADSLYGVTQEERGVSRLVSVHLREAEALVPGD